MIEKDFQDIFVSLVQFGIFILLTSIAQVLMNQQNQEWSQGDENAQNSAEQKSQTECLICEVSEHQKTVKKSDRLNGDGKEAKKDQKITDLIYANHLSIAMHIKDIQHHGHLNQIIRIKRIRENKSGEEFTILMEKGQQPDLTEDNIVQYLLNIYRGINQLLSQGIIHLDLSVKNILEVNGKFKIIDFDQCLFLPLRSKISFLERVEIASEMLKNPQLRTIWCNNNNQQLIAQLDELCESLTKKGEKIQSQIDYFILPLFKIFYQKIMSSENSDKKKITDRIQETINDVNFRINNYEDFNQFSSLIKQIQKLEPPHILNLNSSQMINEQDIKDNPHHFLSKPQTQGQFDLLLKLKKKQLKQDRTINQKTFENQHRQIIFQENQSKSPKTQKQDHHRQVGEICLQHRKQCTYDEQLQYSIKPICCNCIKQGLQNTILCKTHKMEIKFKIPSEKEQNRQHQNQIYLCDGCVRDKMNSDRQSQRGNQEQNYSNYPFELQNLKNICKHKKEASFYCLLPRCKLPKIPLCQKCKDQNHKSHSEYCVELNKDDSVQETQNTQLRASGKTQRQIACHNNLLDNITEIKSTLGRGSFDKLVYTHQLQCEFVSIILQEIANMSNIETTKHLAQKIANNSLFSPQEDNSKDIWRLISIREFTQKYSTDQLRDVTEYLFDQIQQRCNNLYQQVGLLFSSLQESFDQLLLDDFLLQRAECHLNQKYQEIIMTRQHALPCKIQEIPSYHHKRVMKISLDKYHEQKEKQQIKEQVSNKWKEYYKQQIKNRAFLKKARKQLEEIEEGKITDKLQLMSSKEINKLNLIKLEKEELIKEIKNNKQTTQRFSVKQNQQKVQSVDEKLFQLIQQVASINSKIAKFTGKNNLQYYQILRDEIEDNQENYKNEVNLPQRIDDFYSLLKYHKFENLREVRFHSEQEKSDIHSKNYPSTNNIDFPIPLGIKLNIIQLKTREPFSIQQTISLNMICEESLNCRKVFDIFYPSSPVQSKSYNVSGKLKQISYHCSIGCLERKIGRNKYGWIRQLILDESNNYRISPVIFNYDEISQIEYVGWKWHNFFPIASQSNSGQINFGQISLKLSLPSILKSVIFSKIAFDQTTNQLLKRIISLSPSLKELLFDRCSGLQEDSLQFVSPFVEIISLRSLYKIQLFTQQFQGLFLQKCTFLRSLTLHRVKTAKSFRISPCLTQLTTLRLTSLTLDQEFFIELASIPQLPLHLLDLSNTPFDPQLLLKLKTQEIDYLDLSYCDELSERWLESIGRKWNTITYLNIIGCERVSGRSINAGTYPSLVVCEMEIEKLSLNQIQLLREKGIQIRCKSVVVFDYFKQKQEQMTMFQRSLVKKAVIIYFSESILEEMISAKDRQQKNHSLFKQEQKVSLIMHVINKLLSFPNLEDLTIRWDKMSDKKSILLTLEHLTQLTRIKYDNYNEILSHNCLKLVGDMKQLKELHSLSNVDQTHYHAQKLYFRDSNISSQGIPQLQVLYQLPSITNMILNLDKIEDAHYRRIQQTNLLARVFKILIIVSGQAETPNIMSRLEKYPENILITLILQAQDYIEKRYHPTLTSLISRNRQSLRHLKILGSSIRQDIPDNALQVLGECKELITLVLNYFGNYGSFLLSLHHLTHLTLNYCLNVGGVFTKALPNLESLQYLGLASNNWVDNKLVEKIATDLPCLTRLNISACKVDDIGWMSISRMHRLKMLDIGSTQISGQAIARQIENGRLRNLNKLSISRLKINGDEIAKIGKKMQKLTHLHMMRFINKQDQKDEWVDILKDSKVFPNLKYIEVDQQDVKKFNEVGRKELTIIYR